MTPQIRRSLRVTCFRGRSETLGLDFSPRKNEAASLGYQNGRCNKLINWNPKTLDNRGDLKLAGGAEPPGRVTKFFDVLTG